MSVSAMSWPSDVLSGLAWKSLQGGYRRQAEIPPVGKE